MRSLYHREELRKIVSGKKAIKWSDNNLDKLFPFLHHSPSAYNYIALANDLFPAEKSNDNEKRFHQS